MSETNLTPIMKSRLIDVQKFIKRIQGPMESYGITLEAINYDYHKDSELITFSISYNIKNPEFMDEYANSEENEIEEEQ